MWIRLSVKTCHICSIPSKDEDGDLPPSVELSSQGEDNEDDLTGADVSSLDSDLPTIPEETEKEKETTEDATAKESGCAETSDDHCVNGQKEILELAAPASVQEEGNQGANEIQLPKVHHFVHMNLFKSWTLLMKHHESYFIYNQMKASCEFLSKSET